MSEFFKALEQAERDNVPPESPPAPQATTAEAPAETVVDRPAVISRWPEPESERPPVFTPPTPRAAQQVIDPPRPAEDAPRPPAEAPRPFTETPRPDFEAPHPDFEAPRPVFTPPRPVGETPKIASALLDEHLVSLQATSTAAAEQYRVLRHLVEILRRRANLQVIGVTSPGGGDGKTVTAINLAGALSQSDDARVLLVDMDLRHPAIARYLGITQMRPTLADALGAPALPLKDAVVSLPRFNLCVLQAPLSAASPYELLRSPRLEALLTEARQQYDYVVVDTPPFVPFPDSRLIAKSIDGFVLVVASNRTPRGVLAEALKAMDPEKAVGFVFNAHPSRSVAEHQDDNGRVPLWRRKGERV
jgi:capsular exopolysaccharide synthesis family protein